MLVIPVIDILNGIVVHAVSGERNKYKPIKSVLCEQNSPLAIVNAYYKLYPFNTIYIADLNAIQDEGDNGSCINEIVDSFPQFNFWIDTGIQKYEVRDVLNHQNVFPVIGTENNLEKKTYKSLLLAHSNSILSMDMNQSGLIDKDLLFESPSLWTDKIILMMLDRVGNNSGVEIDRLNHYLSLRKENEIYYAGGVKNLSDLEKLRAKKVDGALVATALHNGVITREDLESLE